MARIMFVSEDDTMRRYIGDKLKAAGHFTTRVTGYEHHPHFRIDSPGFMGETDARAIF